MTPKRKQRSEFPHVEKRAAEQDAVAKAIGRLADMLWSSTRENQEGDRANMVDALFAIADALNGVARQIRDLGNGDAATPMGAIEAFGMHIGEKIDALASAVGSLKDEA
jgi:hypothetical protein